jgi:4-hydroxy-tetrahydrodipicolinate reductase
VLGLNYNIGVDETHHIHKKDAPSGSALRLGEKVCEGLKKDLKDMMVHDPEGQMDEPPENKILMRSYRKGEVVGDHTVSFENNGERIEFTHHAWTRDAFANGALRAALWVVTQPQLGSLFENTFSNRS